MGITVGMRVHRAYSINSGPEALIGVIWPLYFAGPLLRMVFVEPAKLLNSAVDKWQDRKRLPEAKARYNED